MRFLIPLLIAAPSLALADEVPSPKMMLVTKGVMCDTQQELETLLTGISLNQGQFPDDSPAGCGMVTMATPSPAFVTPIGWYETPLAKSLVAEFRFTNGWLQYAWIDFVLNEDYDPEPAGLRL